MPDLPVGATVEPAGPPACFAAEPSLTGKRRGNPDLGFAPRCGARTRGGCQCRAPAIHGRLRCPAGQPPGKRLGARPTVGRLRMAGAAPARARPRA